MSKKILYSTIAVLSLVVLVLSYQVVGSEVPADNAAEFTSDRNHDISLEDAIGFTRNYRESVAPGEKLGGFFGSDAILGILEQEDAVGLRYYFGKDKDGTMLIVLVGTDANGQDLVYGRIADLGLPCPPYCPFENELNSDLEPLSLSIQ